MALLDAPANVELGNHSRMNAVDSRHAVTYIHIPAAYTHASGLSGVELRQGLELAASRQNGTVTTFPDHTAALLVAHPGGAFQRHVSPIAPGKPAWVWSDHADLQRLLSEVYDCPEGRPGDYVDNYWRVAGPRELPPGVPAGTAGPDMVLMNAGRYFWANCLGGGQTGVTGSSSATSSTSLTATSTPALTSNQYQNWRIYAALASGGMVWGVINTHTSGTSPVFTVDQWYAIPETGAASGGIPPTSGMWIIASGGAQAAWYIGLSTSSATPLPTDTLLAGENFTSPTNGMNRKIAGFSLTSGTSPASYVITAVYAYVTGSPASLTFYRMGAFYSSVYNASPPSGFTPMVFETLFNASFTVTNNGDSATISDSISGS